MNFCRRFFQVKVTTMGGTMQTLRCRPSISISDLKKRIESAFGAPAWLQQLFVTGSESDAVLDGLEMMQVPRS